MAKRKSIKKSKRKSRKKSRKVKNVRRKSYKMSKRKKRKSKRKSVKMKSVKRKSVKRKSRRKSKRVATLKRKRKSTRRKKSVKRKSRRKSKRKSRMRRLFSKKKDVEEAEKEKQIIPLEAVKPSDHVNMTIEEYSEMLKKRKINLYIETPAPPNRTKPKKIYLRARDDGSILFQGKLIPNEEERLIVKDIEPIENYKPPQQNDSGPDVNQI